MVLTGLFSAEEAAAAPPGDAFYTNLKQDIEVECKKAGDLDKVFVFEASEKGAVIAKVTPTPTLALALALTLTLTLTPTLTPTSSSRPRTRSAASR